MDPSKVETVKVWPPPKSLQDVRAFLGFTDFYCRFVKGYSKVVEPLTQLTRKGQPFKWETKQLESFDRLKTSFTTAPILCRFDHDRDIVVETAASDFVSAAVTLEARAKGDNPEETPEEETRGEGSGMRRDSTPVLATWKRTSGSESLGGR